jgi:hypothetical protein
VIGTLEPAVGNVANEPAIKFTPSSTVPPSVVPRTYSLKVEVIFVVSISVALTPPILMEVIVPIIEPAPVAKPEPTLEIDAIFYFLY